MISSTLGTKQQMTQIYLQDGSRFGVTLIKLMPASVIMTRSVEKDGYEAVQVGFGSSKRSSKPVAGHLKKHSLTSTFQRIQEVAAGKEGIPDGQSIAVAEMFTAGDIISVSAVSKGKGNAGVIKRWGFHGGPKTHGQSDRHRAPGSVGSGTTPGRIYKGKKMAGRMGHEMVTVKNLLVLEVDVTNQILYVSGSVPGARNTEVMVTKTGHKDNLSPVINVKKTDTETAGAKETLDEVTEAVQNTEVENTAQTDSK